MEKVRSSYPVGVMYLLPVLAVQVCLSLQLSKPIPLITCPLTHSY